MKNDKKKLESAGYYVKVFTPYHWEVSRDGGTKIISVWPTAQKILVKFQPGPAPRYKGSLLDAVDELYFGHPEYPPTYTPAQIEMMGFFWEYRERGLDVIRELIDA